MKIAVLPLALFALTTVPAAHADDASKRTKIAELLTVLKVNQVPDQILAGANQQADALGHREFGATETPDQQKQVADLRQKVSALISSAVDWKTIEPDFVTAYAAVYSEPEIDGILTFYKSPSGQALLKNGPDLGQKSSQIVQGRMSSIQPQLREIVQSFNQKNAPAPAGSTTPSHPTPPAGTSPSSTTPPASK